MREDRYAGSSFFSNFEFKGKPIYGMHFLQEARPHLGPTLSFQVEEEWVVIDYGWGLEQRIPLDSVPRLIAALQELTK